MTKVPTPTENPQKATWQHTDATKNFDYTTFADRIRTVSWGNDSQPTEKQRRWKYITVMANISNYTDLIVLNSFKWNEKHQSSINTNSFWTTLQLLMRVRETHLASYTQTTARNFILAHTVLEMSLEFEYPIPTKDYTNDRFLYEGIRIRLETTVRY